MPKNRPNNIIYKGVGEKGSNITNEPPKNGQQRDMNAGTTENRERSVASERHDSRRRSSGGPSVWEQVLSWRAVMYLLLHLSYITLGLPRTTTNMALVCSESRRHEILALANRSSLPSDGDSVLLEEGYVTGDNSTSSYGSDGDIMRLHGNVMSDLNWDSGTKGLMLSAPFFTSWTSAMISDVIRRRIGNRLVLTSAHLIAGVLTLISPVLARTSPYLFLANQVLVGLTMDVNTPVVGDAVSRWTPVSQRLTATFLVFAGYSTGAIINSVVNGFLCSIPFDNGWPLIYYYSGFALFVYAAAWFFLGADSPENHRYISSAEKAYILSTRAQLVPNTQGKRPERPPYGTIIRSLPVLTFIYCHVCFVWAACVVLVTLPMYVSGVLGFTSTETGVVYSGIICARFIGAFWWTLVGNLLTNRKILSAAVTVKSCIIIGMAGGAFGCMSASFFHGSDRWSAIALLMTGMFMQAVASSQLHAMPQVMAPRYAGSVLGISSSSSHLIALTGPLVVAALTPTGSYEEWRVVWLIVAGVFLSASLTFLAFGRAQLQPWAVEGPAGKTAGQEKGGITTEADVEMVVQHPEEVNEHLLPSYKPDSSEEIVTFQRPSTDAAKGDEK